MPAAPPKSFRGEMVDVGGRRLRVVTAGPDLSRRPTVVLEHGAFGCATDWAVVQERLAAKGLRSIAYDRAGMGYSDAGPRPRDGRSIVVDLAALLRELDENRPVILAGHSMGGLMVRLFAGTHPERVLGVVLVDAVTPEVMGSPVGSRAVKAFDRALRVVSQGAKLGMMRPVAAIMGDRIGLSGAASAEKRRIYGLASHARWASEEVASWAVTSDQAAALDFPPAMPVAVITAGGANTPTALKVVQVIPALGSARGYVEHVDGAGHANLLGRRFADPVVRGVEQVLAAVGR